MKFAFPSPLRVLLVGLAAMCLCAVARAQLYQVTLSGKVFYVNGSGFDSTVAVGTTLTEKFVMDQSIPASSSDPTYIAYLYLSTTPPYAPPHQSSASVGNYNFLGGITYLTFSQNVGTGSNTIQLGTLPSQYNMTYFFADLISSNAEVLGNGTQPLAQLPLSDFDKGALLYLGVTSLNQENEFAQWTVAASVDSFAVTPYAAPVPEASTYGIAGGVLVLGLAALRLRRRK